MRTLLLGLALVPGCGLLPGSDCSESKGQCQACCDKEHGEGKRVGWIEHRRTRMNGTEYDACICDRPLSDDEKAEHEARTVAKKSKKERSAERREQIAKLVPSAAVLPVTYGAGVAIDPGVEGHCPPSQGIRDALVAAGHKKLTPAAAAPSSGFSLAIEVTKIDTTTDTGIEHGRLALRGSLSEGGKSVAAFTAEHIYEPRSRTGYNCRDASSTVFKFAGPILAWLAEPKDGAKLDANTPVPWPTER